MKTLIVMVNTKDYEYCHCVGGDGKETKEAIMVFEMTNIVFRQGRMAGPIINCRRETVL